MSQLKQHCSLCKKETLWRYLDCEECRAKGIECIYICTECGCSDDEAMFKSMDAEKDERNEYLNNLNEGE